MDITMLKAIMVQHGENQTELANAMGLAQSGLSARFNGNIEFKKNEINFIRKRYALTDEQTVLIFFNEKVS